MKDKNTNLKILLPFCSLSLLCFAGLSFGQEQPKIDNLYFSMMPLDNWTYSQASDSPTARILGFGPINTVILTPLEFSNIQLDDNRTLSEKMQDEGAYSVFRLDVDYPLKNAPLETYVKYNIDKQDGFNVVSQRNVTIDGEKAVKIFEEVNGIKLVEYMVIHKDDPYRIWYVANSKDYEKYLPQFEYMVDSFKFAKKSLS